MKPQMRLKIRENDAYCWLICRFTRTYSIAIFSQYNGLTFFGFEIGKVFDFNFNGKMNFDFEFYQNQSTLSSTIYNSFKNFWILQNSFFFFLISCISEIKSVGRRAEDKLTTTEPLLKTNLNSKFIQNVQMRSSYW